MKSANSLRKVAIDMSLLQSSWAVWFLVIVLIVYIVAPFFGIDVVTDNKLGQLFANIVSGQWGDDAVQAEQRGFSTFISHPAKIFMLVCGILSVPSFLTFFVKQGLTRKNYFYGAAIASVAVACFIALAAGIVLLIERAFFTPDLELGSSWLFAILVFAMHIMSYYVAGWLIGAGFYRYGIGGMLFIVLAIMLLFAVEILWEMGLVELLHVSGFIEGLLLSLITLALLAVMAVVVRVMTKRVRIKLK